MKLDKNQLRNIIVSELHEAAKETITSIAGDAAPDCSSALAAALGSHDEVIAVWMDKVKKLTDSQPALRNNPGVLDQLLRDAIEETFSSAELDEIGLELAIKAIKSAVANPKMDTAKLSDKADKTLIMNRTGP